VSGIEALHYDGESDGLDALRVTTTNATIVPGPTPGSGTVLPVDTAAPLLARYVHVASATVTGTTAVVRARPRTTRSAPALGVVSVTNLLGHSNNINVAGFPRWSSTAWAATTRLRSRRARCSSAASVSSAANRASAAIW
jgi:hypothetical protein